MNQYLKIPRGINVKTKNDLIFQKTVEAIGKQYGRLLTGQYKSDYAKGKAFLSKKYGIKKTAIKKIHTVKISTRGHNDIGDNYSNYVSLHILLTEQIIIDIIKSVKEQGVDFRKIANSISNGDYDSNSLYIDALFEETLHWMSNSMMDNDNICYFNRNNASKDELIDLYNHLKKITDKIGDSNNETINK